MSDVKRLLMVGKYLFDSALFPICMLCHDRFRLRNIKWAVWKRMWGRKIDSQQNIRPRIIQSWGEKQNRNCDFVTSVQICRVKLTKKNCEWQKFILNWLQTSENMPAHCLYICNFVYLYLYNCISVFVFVFSREVRTLVGWFSEEV